MAEEKETFVERWSRLKREAEAEAPPPARKEEAPPPLPPVEKLTPGSDFAPFMHPKVADAMRRVALKKLFADPHFNVPDPFEAYSGDWTGGDPIPEELLKTLHQARTVLFREEATKESPKPAEPAAEPREEAAAKQGPQDDGAGRQDA
jgi:hypothetical protein